MAGNRDLLNLTLYFDYENNEAGFNSIMTSLDRISNQAEQTMRANSQLFDRGELEQSVAQYRNYIERIKDALEQSWNIDTQSFDLTRAIQIDPEAFNAVRNGLNGVRVNLEDTDSAFRNSQNEVSKYSKTLDNFRLTIGNAFRYNVVNEFVDAITTQFRDAIYYIKDLDKALNNIRIVSGQSSEDMYKFAESANSSAKALARTATEYAQAAQIYYQQGLKQQDVISRTNDTLLLANITGDSVADAADKLTSVMNGYQLATEDSTRALDVMAKLGADTATDFAEIASAMQKVAAQANSANLTLEQTTAMLSTIMSITREAPETVGTSLKAIIARLNELKVASGTETSRVQKQFSAIGMSIFDANGQLKETTVLFDEIAEAFKTADVNTKKVIATAVAGAEQQNRFLTLMENWDTYNEYLDKAYNSSGAALQQNEIYMESIQAKSKQLKSTLDSIKFDLFMGEDFGAMLDSIDSIAVTVGNLIHDFGGLNEILIIGASLMGKMFLPEIVNKMGHSIAALENSIQKFKEGGIRGFIGTGLFGTDPNILTTSINNLASGLQNVEERESTLRTVTNLLGEEAAEHLNNQINSLQRLREQQENLQSTLIRKLGLASNEDMLGAAFNQESALQYSEDAVNQFDRMSEALERMGVHHNDTALIIEATGEALGAENLEAIQTTQVLTAMATVLRDIQLPNSELNSQLETEASNLRLVEGEIRRLNRAMEEQAQRAARVARTQNIVSGFMAASVAVGSLVNALTSFSEGDFVAGITTSFNGIGSSLMMLSNAWAPAVGVALMGVGTIISALNSHFEKQEQKTRELVERNISLVESYTKNKNKVEDLLISYEKLTSKILKTKEEQDELNQVIFDFQEILGEQNDFVAYYDSSGKAVYKTKEQVNALIKTWKEEQKEAAKAALADAKILSKDDTKYYAKKQTEIEKTREELNKYNEASKAMALASEEASEKNGAELFNYFKEIVGLNSEFADLQIIWQGTWVDTQNLIEQRAQQSSNKLEQISQDIIENTQDLSTEISAAFSVGLSSLGDDENYSLITEKIKEKIFKSLEEGTLSTTENIGDSITLFLETLSNLIDTNEIDFSKLISGDTNELTVMKVKIREIVANNPELEILNELFEELQKIILENRKATEELAEEEKNHIASYQELSTAVDRYSKVIENTRDAIKEFNENGVLTSETLNNLKQAFGSLNGYSDFIDKLNNGQINASNLREELESLAGEYWNTQVAINGVTESSRNQLAAMLKNIGITNSTELATIKYVDSLVKSNTAGKTFQEVCNMNASSLGLEGEAAEYAKLSLYELRLSMIQANEAKLDFSQQITELTKLATEAQIAGVSIEAIQEAVGVYMKAGLTETEAQERTLKAFGERFKNQFDLMRANLSSVKTGIGAAPGSSGGDSKSEEYKAEIDKYEKYTQKIEELEEEISDLDREINNTDDFKEKNRYIEEQIRLMEQEKSVQLELNAARDKEIQQNVETLRSKGFQIRYDSTEDKLYIDNLEHLNELQAENGKTTGDTIKKYEELINKTKDLNSANKDAKNSWEDLIQKQKEAQEQIEKNIRDSYKNDVSDELFKTIFYEHMQGGQEKVKEIYEDVLATHKQELSRLYEIGKTIADDSVQETIKSIYDMKDKIFDIDKDIYENKKKNIDRVADILAKDSNTTVKEVDLAGERIKIIQNEINKNLKDGSKEAVEYAKELWEELADALKKQYDLQLKILNKQKDNYDSTIDAVGNAIDKEIDRLKEEQEALKKANEEREKEIELMKLKAALELANDQKTIQVYRHDQGFVWEADQEAIDKAQEDLDKFNNKNAPDPIQDRIDELEKYKKEWEGIPDKIKDAENEAIAAEILGSDWLAKVLDTDKGLLDDFGDKYKDLADEIKDLNENFEKQMDSLAEKSKEVAKQVVDAVEIVNTAVTGAFASGNRIFNTDENGIAPEGLNIGDYARSTAGIWQITGFSDTTASGYTSKKVAGAEYGAARSDLKGQQIIDEGLLKQLASVLNEEFVEIIETQVEEIKTNTEKVADNSQVIVDLNKGLEDYSESIVTAVKNTDASAKNAKVSETNSKSYADSAQRSASAAAQSASEAASSASAAKTSSGGDGETTGGNSNSTNNTQQTYTRVINGTTYTFKKKHSGLLSGPVGDGTIFEDDLLRIAQGSIKNDELLTLLRKGEYVLTPEQLENITNALGYSLNTIGALGKIGSLNLGASRLQNSKSVQIDNINIEMNGVNDVNSFSQILQANIKGVLAQAINER